MLAIVQAAGWPIWTIIVASVAALAIIIERSVSLRRRAVSPPGLLKKVLAESKTQKGLEEYSDLLAKSSPLGVILSAGLQNRSSSREIMKESIEEAGSAVAHKLERYLNTLGSIAAVSPLLGLLGTVIGMIEIFGAQSPTGGNNPAALAHGISIALYNTAFGIIVAVPSLLFYRHFKARVNGLLVDMEQQAVHLVETLHGERDQ